MRQGQENTFNFLVQKNNKCKKTYQLLLKEAVTGFPSDHLKSLQTSLETSYRNKQNNEASLFEESVRNKMRISGLQQALCIHIFPIAPSLEKTVKKNFFLHNDSFSVTSLLLPTLP